MDVSIVVSLLPLFFLLHELEEIIMVRSWLDKNQAVFVSVFQIWDILLCGWNK